MTHHKSYAPTYRHGFSIPVSEYQLETWVRHQSHLSHSIRRLIRWYVKNYGTTDALCENLDEPLVQYNSFGRTY